MWTESVAADTALLLIPLDSALLSLPQGAAYTARSGRASVKASVRQGKDGTPPTLIIESGCDSLARLCAYYEAENERLSVANSHLSSAVQTASKRQTNGVWTIILTAIAGIAAGTVITLITRRIWQRQY